MPGASLTIVGVSGGLTVGANSVVNADVQASGGAQTPVAVAFDFSDVFGPDNMLNEYIENVITPGGAAAVASAKTGRPLSQVNASYGAYPSGGVCTVMTNFARQVTLAFVANNILYSDGGVLAIVPVTDNYPAWSASLAAGALYSNGHVVTVAGTISPNPRAAPVFFPGITGNQLLALGGGDLPLWQSSFIGSGRLCVSSLTNGEVIVA